MKWFLSFLTPFFLFSQSGVEIATLLDQKLAPKDLSNKAKMILTNYKGKSRTSEMVSKSLNRNEKQMIWFLEPRDDRGVSFLKVEHENGEDEMRMWLPAFKRVRRISAKKKGDSFMGSDLTFEDLSNRDLTHNNYKRLDDDMFDKVECFVLETLPKKEAQSSYSRHVSWIDKKTFNLLKEISYDKRGVLEKDKRFEYELIKSFFILKRVLVNNTIKQHSTEIIFTDIQVDMGTKSDLFHEKNLRRLPKE